MKALLHCLLHPPCQRVAMWVGQNRPMSNLLPARPWRRLARTAACAALSVAAALPAIAATQVKDEAIVDAREALRKKDRTRLAALRQAVVTANHPLAGWVDYWDLGSRLNEVQQTDLDAFYARWPGSYVEDRLRNDWLQELGRRRDWANFNREHPRFRMNDDREVTCYALLNQHLAGQDVKAAARAAWYAQRELDDGCNLLASTLFDARLLSPADVWREVRLSVEFNRVRPARAAAGFVDANAATAVHDLFDNPARYLKRRVDLKAPLQKELSMLAVVRLAASDPESAAAELEPLQKHLTGEQLAWAWAVTAKQAALKLLPQAADMAQRAWRAQRPLGVPQWSDDALAWQVRAAVRSAQIDRERWRLVVDAVDAMTPQEQKDSAWVYWRARAVQALAKAGPEGDADRQAAGQSLQALAGTLGFYGKLAAEELGQPFKLPPTPAPLTEAEMAAAAGQPGFRRALAMAALGLRDEARREWNFTLRGMSDRELLAAAQTACNLADWQLCINTSERTRQDVDVRQRYPQPFRAEILARAQERGLDPAFVFGLIRQETRFMPALKSSAGAQGLMQLMPATARWTARRIGLTDYRPENITDIDVNLRLGTAYLKVLVDDFAGAQPLAAAAYNAGPGRPRRWRDGPVIESAAWAENVPFNETRDYVKKVISNAVVYSALIGGGTPSIKLRLGPSIGPRDSSAPGADREIP